MRIIVDKKFKQIRENLDNIRVDRIAKRLLDRAGREIASVMTRVLSHHDYTGELSSSVQCETTVSGATAKVEIEPTARRRQWHAGSILQHGATNLRNIPFTPIKRWAEFRGLPAGPVWMSIRQSGRIQGHSWLPLVASDSQTRGAINEVRQDLGRDISLQILGLKRRE